MSFNLTGRKVEQEELQKLYASKYSEFLAIYGRRRVGKTYLIKQYFTENIKKADYFFSITGIQNGSMLDQINRFILEIGKVFYNNLELKGKSNWFDVFDVLIDAINKNVAKNQKVVLFFDEFPWLVTKRSKLLTVLEYFWNQYWSNDPRIKLIVCGSSASWIVKKIINNKGGLHNRITMKIQLSPFNLQETKEFLLSKDIKLNNMQIAQLYMVTGGIPYYLSAVQRGLSAVQIIEHLAFKQNSILYNEFDNLFASLFHDAVPYIRILKTIAKHRYGLSQEELIRNLPSISKGGRLSAKLAELEEAGFILQFIPHLHKKRGIYYRVIDEYTMFYLKWIEPLKSTLQKRALEDGYWQQERNSAAWNSWAGYAFESICYKHLSQIRQHLKILPNAITSAWRFVPTSKSPESNGAQIDLLFDRKDDAITICEIKYCEQSFVIDKNYAKILQNKIAVFVNKTKTSKQIILAMIAANGIKDNIHADAVDAVVTLDDLFIIRF